MNKAAAQMKEADAAIAAQKAELDKLNQIITEADQVTHPSHHFPQPSLANIVLVPPSLSHKPLFQQALSNGICT